jgi:predicted RNA-binding Zn-ribbon protein involved in translation (DUF1610 family)
MAPEKLMCPQCGSEMNRHCEKIMYANGAENEGLVDPVLGGILQEFHTCPKCGSSAARAART